MKKVWEKPELKDIVKGIETVFIWNSGKPDYRPWEEEQKRHLPPQRYSIFGKIKSIFAFDI